MFWPFNKKKKKTVSKSPISSGFSSDYSQTFESSMIEEWPVRHEPDLNILINAIDSISVDNDCKCGSCSDNSYSDNSYSDNSYSDNSSCSDTSTSYSSD